MIEPTKRRKKLPAIEAITKRRIEAGIADLAEMELFYSNDLVDEDYSDEFKQRLLDQLAAYRRGRRASPTYWELLRCTNEVVRTVLPLRLRLRNGNHPGFTIARQQLLEAVRLLRANRQRFRQMFGRRTVHEARALLWVIGRDMRHAASISYMKDPEAFIASLD